MKLTIEHLAVYPMDEDTGLLIQTKLRKATRSGQPLGYYTGMLIGVSKRGSGVEIVFDKDDFSEDYDVEEIKPILRPISDLAKDEYFNNVYLLIGGGWKDYKTFKNAMLDNYLYSPTEVMSYRIVNLLLSMHFDVFRLIDQGLAIDINSIEL